MDLQDENFPQKNRRPELSEGANRVLAKKSETIIITFCFGCFKSKNIYLKEISPLRHKGICSQLNQWPKLVEMVVVKDDYLPHNRS